MTCAALCERGQSGPVIWKQQRRLLAQFETGADTGVMGMAVMADGSPVIAAYSSGQHASAVIRLRL